MDLVVFGWLVVILILLFVGVRVQKLFLRVGSRNDTESSRRNNIDIRVFSVENSSRAYAASSQGGFDREKEKDDLPSYAEIFPDVEPPRYTPTIQGNTETPIAVNSQPSAVIVVEENSANR